MPTAEQQLLHLIHFSNITKWSVGASPFLDVTAKYPLVPLSKILLRVKEAVSIENDQLYKRITVRLYGKGVLLRDELPGRDIGTKRQFAAHSGQLVISRIDARNGAFGLVPDELDGAVVTNDFWLFDVDQQAALPQYLMLALSSDRFQQYWQSKSSGTTNRQRVNVDDFLSSKIALPPLSEQRELLDRYNKSVTAATEIEQQSIELQHAQNEFIFQTLGISCSTQPSENCLLNMISYKNLERWDPPHLMNQVFIASACPLVSMSHVVRNFLTDRNGKSLRRNTKGETKCYQYIGMENVIKNTGERVSKYVEGREIQSQTLAVPPDYIIYGKLRPYLNKYWENTTNQNNIICSSEFFVFQTKGIERDYFMAILSSDVIQKQLPPLFSGARMPRITETDFLNLKIPLPCQKTQLLIMERAKENRAQICDLLLTASKLKRSAKIEFEEAVFGAS